MSVFIQIPCLENHADEVRLITEGQNFKQIQIQPGRGFERTVLLFEGRQPSLGVSNLEVLLETAFKRQCQHDIKVTVLRCPKCDKDDLLLLPAGDYQLDGSTWFKFDNAVRLGFKCSDCACIFGTPLGAYNADPKFGLKSLDEALG